MNNTKNDNAKGEALQESGIGVIKGIIGAVPYFGTMLNEALFDIRSRIKQKRLEDFVQNLDQKLEGIDHRLIDRAIIQSDEFSDFIESVIKKILRIKSKQKMDTFSDILASTMISKNVNDYGMRDIYISILANLSENEMLILEHLYRYSEAAERNKKEGKELEMTRIDYSQPQQMGVNTDEFKICFETLISKGLVFDDSFGRLSTKPRSFIMPTQLAVKLIHFIKECKSLTDDKSEANTSHA